MGFELCHCQNAYLHCTGCNCSYRASAGVFGCTTPRSSYYYETPADGLKLQISCVYVCVHSESVIMKSDNFRERDICLVQHQIIKNLSFCNFVLDKHAAVT